MLTLRVTLDSGETHDVEVAPETVVTFKTTTLDGRLREQHAVFAWSGVAGIEVVDSAAPAPTPTPFDGSDAVVGGTLGPTDVGEPTVESVTELVVEPGPPVVAGEPGDSGGQTSEPQPTTETGDPIPTPETNPVDPPVATGGSPEPSTPSPGTSTDTSTIPADPAPMAPADIAAHDAAVANAANAVDLAPIVAPEDVPKLIADALMDVATALANWPDSPELADAKAKLDTLAADLEPPTA